MTLSEFALLVDATPKWVLNTRAILRQTGRYTVPAAERLALTRMLNLELGIPLRGALQLAAAALSDPLKDDFQLKVGDGLVTLAVDVARVRAAVATRAARIRTMPLRKRAGRKPRRARDAIAAARAYGIDVTLLQANLMRTPEERLRQLDETVAFFAHVGRPMGK